MAESSFSKEAIPLSYKKPVLTTTCSFWGDWEVSRILAWIIGQCCSYKVSNTTMPLILERALFNNIKNISKTSYTITSALVCVKSLFHYYN